MKTNAKRGERLLSRSEFEDAVSGDATAADSRDVFSKRSDLATDEPDSKPSADREPVTSSSTRIVRALQTFFFEVSAGRRGGAGEVTPSAGLQRALQGGDSLDVIHEKIAATAWRSAPPKEAGPSHQDALTRQDGAAARREAAPTRVESPLRKTSPEPVSVPLPVGAARSNLQRPVAVTPSGGTTSSAMVSKLRSKPPSSGQENANQRLPLQVRRTRTVPSWLMSALAHLALIALLSTIRFAAPSLAPNFLLTSSTDDPEELEAFANIETPSVEVSEQISESSEASFTDLGHATERLSAGNPLADAIAERQGAAAATNAFGDLFDGVRGLTGAPDALGGEATARFFGTSISGRRILFLLDNSGSMQGGRLETVLAELEQSVASLTPQQKFYVIFFSDDVYPLFFPQAASDYVAVNESVMASLKQWLRGVELCYGDVIDEALQAANSIQPDMVFLLSDGKIASSRDLQALLAPGKPYPIHTFGVGLGNAVTARENLRRIAEANGGEFREAGVPADMREQAEREPRPYHRNAPGDSWGRRVAPK